LANTKSAKKDILTSAKRAERNKSARSALKTTIRKAEKAIASGEGTENALIASQSALDIAAKKGIIHANTAARKKSRLAKKLNAA
jgi:small subunit ribosomal protein S20